MHDRRFVRFLAVGGFAALVNVVARYLLDMVMGYSAAIVLAYLVGMLTAFFLSKLFVFEAATIPARTQFVRFGVVNLAAVVQVWAVSWVLAEWVLPAVGLTGSRRYDLAHLIGVLVPAVTSYFGHKHYSFEKG